MTQIFPKPTVSKNYWLGLEKVLQNLDWPWPISHQVVFYLFVCFMVYYKYVYCKSTYHSMEDSSLKNFDEFSDPCARTGLLLLVVTLFQVFLDQWCSVLSPHVSKKCAVFIWTVGIQKNNEEGACPEKYSDLSTFAHTHICTPFLHTSWGTWNWAQLKHFPGRAFVYICKTDANMSMVWDFLLCSIKNGF